MSDAKLAELEAKLEKAGDSMSQALKAASEEERKELSSIYDKIKDLVAQHEAESEAHLDASALFAAAIIANEKIKNADVIKAASDYIDCDLEYCRCRSGK